MGPFRLGEGSLGILLIGTIHPPLVIDLALAVTVAICSARELCADTWGDEGGACTPELSLPFPTLHRTPQLRPFSSKDPPGGQHLEPTGLPRHPPPSPALTSPHPPCSVSSLLICQETQKCLWHLPLLSPPSLPPLTSRLLKPAPGLSRLEGSCSDSQLCTSPPLPGPSSPPVMNDGLAKKAEASAKMKGLSEQLSGVSVSSYRFARPGFRLCWTPRHQR